MIVNGLGSMAALTEGLEKIEAIIALPNLFLTVNLRHGYDILNKCTVCKAFVCINLTKK